MEKRKIIIDTDPGVDDALALFLLARAKNIDIKLIVACCGNSGVANTTRNANYLINRFGIDAPLAVGLDDSLTPKEKRLKLDMKKIHGKYSGLGNLEIPNFSVDAERDFCSEIRKVLDENEKVTYVVFGPLTNLAYFLDKNPEYKKKIDRIVFMGGVKDRVVEGHVYSEFNIGMDSVAAKIVLKNKIDDLVMVPSELGHFAYFTQKDVEKIKKMNRMGADFGKMFDGYFDRMVPKDCIATHDACVAAYLIDKSMFRELPAKIKVKYFKEIHCSVIVNDIESRKPNCMMVVDIDHEKFRQMCFKYLKDFGK